MGLEVRFALCDYREKRIHDEKSVTFEKEDVDGETIVETVANTLDIPSSEIDLFFAGRRIQKSNDFFLKEKTRFFSGGKIQVLYRPVEQIPQSDPATVDAGELKMCMAGLHLMLNNRHQRWKSRKAVLKILKSKESLQEILDSVPNIESDTTSIDILKNPDLFASVVHPKNCNNILELHPHLAAALVKLSHKVSLNGSSSTSRGQVEIAMDTESSSGSSQNARSSRLASNLSTPRGQSIITSSQLAQALSLANSPAIFPSPIGTPASLRSPISASSPGPGAAVASQGANSGVITQDVFSQAMQQALSQTTSQGSVAGNSVIPSTTPMQSLPDSVMQDGLEQLRSMGIGDEEASRQALIAAGGNVQTAVNILFASRMDDL